MEDVIRRFYPNAIRSADFVQKTYDVLKDYNLDPENVLVARSLCSDDINSIQFRQQVRRTLGPFYLGGLAGFPFAGLTGFGAFAHHVPDEGAAGIVYGPHIGIGQEGIPGSIRRAGQTHSSGCCGAVLKALDRLQKNELVVTSPDPMDYQQETLERIIVQHRQRIQNSRNQLMEAVEVILEASGEFIDRLIERTAFSGKYVFVVGMVMVNSDFKHESFVEARRFDCLNVHTREKLAVDLSKFAPVT